MYNWDSGAGQRIEETGNRIVLIGTRVGSAARMERRNLTTELDDVIDQANALIALAVQAKADAAAPPPPMQDRAKSVVAVFRNAVGAWELDSICNASGVAYWLTFNGGKLYATVADGQGDTTMLAIAEPAEGVLNRIGGILAQTANNRSEMIDIAWQVYETIRLAGSGFALNGEPEA